MDLILPLKRKYFEEIKAGRKPEEYRLKNAYWEKRLEGKTFDRLILTLGYPARDDHERRLVLPWQGYVVREGHSHPLFGSLPVTVYAINVQHAGTLPDAVPAAEVPSCTGGPQPMAAAEDRDANRLLNASPAEVADRLLSLLPTRENASGLFSMAGCRSLRDQELVEEGDVIKDLAAGENREVSVDSLDGLLIGLTAGAVRKMDGVSKEPDPLKGMGI